MTEEKNSEEKAKKEVKLKEAAIVGTAGSSAHLAPVDDPNVDIFGLAWRKSAKKADKVFEMHRQGSWRVSVPPEYFSFLNELIKEGTEVIAYDYIPGVEGVTVYPFKEIVKYLSEISGTDTEESAYFSSSIAYMFAYAMYTGYKKISIYGVDMSTDQEYTHQKPNLEYLIGLARGQGIKVVLPKACALVKGTHIYGYDPTPGDGGGITLAELKKRKKQYDQEHEAAKAQFYTLDGARQVIDEQIQFIQQINKGVAMGNYADFGKPKDK